MKIGSGEFMNFEGKNLILIFVIIALISGAALFFFFSPQESKAESTQFNFSIQPGSNPSLGNKNAKIIIIEFTDFSCPFCKKFALSTISKIKDNEVKEGKALYYMRDFQLPQHPNTFFASLAARCAAEQEKFYEMYSLLFERQEEWSYLDSNSLKAVFSSYASALDIDTLDFVTCYESKKYASYINKDVEDGKSFGVRGTPTTFVILSSINENKLRDFVKKYTHFIQKGYIKFGKDLNNKNVFIIVGAHEYMLFKEIFNLAE